MLLMQQRIMITCLVILFLFLKEINIKIGTYDDKIGTEGTETENLKYLRLMCRLQAWLVLVFLSLQLILVSLEHL